jgi:serine protease Do
VEDKTVMNTRTRTIASFFSIAMAAMLLGAVVTTQVRTQTAMARPAEPATSKPADRPPAGPVNLNTFRDIARMQTAGVVNINTKRTVRRRSSDPFHDFFGDDLMERFFGPQGDAPGQGQGQGQGRGRTERQTQRSLGSGFIIDAQGHILTNRHVIEGADQISVTLNNGKDYDAKLVGKDARTDVALLKIEPKETLTTLNLGDSDAIEVGEWVMAIGNPFGLGGNSVTVGVVSYKGRSMSLTRGTGIDMIQTDAAINPGNSGGPLLNTRGEVIGLNTLIVTGGLQQSAGVGFSVPINVAKEILPQLRDTGKVVRGWMGVSIQPVTEDLAKTYRMAEAKGAVISDVTPNSPAATAGLEPGDVVVQVDGRVIEDNNDLSRYVSSRAPGTNVRLKVLRNGSEKAVTLVLGTFPEETADAEEQEQDAGVQLGMTLRELTPDLAARLELPRTAKGVVVMDVEAGSAAEDAGMQRGDVIVSVNGQTVEDPDDFKQEIDKARADGVARLRVRNGNTHRFTVLKLR